MVGMTNREIEMIERFEAGESIADIAKAMGVAVETVRRTTSYYTTGLADDGGNRVAMTACCRELLRRINAERRL